MEMMVEGVVTGKNRNIYTITTGNKEFSIYYEKNLEIGQSGKFSLRMTPQGYRCVSFHEDDKIYDKVYTKLYESISPDLKPWLVENDVTKCLNNDGLKVIKHLVVSYRLGRKILVRFHNDADGIVGGLALKRLLNNVLNFQNKGAVYKPMFAIHDISLLRNSFKPILVMVDFGSGEESKEGLELLKSAGIERVIIDHHPYKEMPNVEHYISPWRCGGDSQYPAGYITCELVSPFIDEDLSFLKRISLAGDKSKLVSLSDHDKKLAMILDYLSLYSRFPNTLSFYDTVLNDDNILHSIELIIDEKTESIQRTAKHYIKERRMDGLTLVLLNVDKLVKKNEFPSKSKAVGIVFEMYDDPVILIGYGKKLITFRISENAKKIVNALEIINHMKKLYPEGVLAGGGHDAAASMRCDPMFTDVILDAIVELIKNKLDKK